MGEKMKTAFCVQQAEYFLDDVRQLQNRIEGMRLGQAERMMDKGNVDDDMIEALKKVSVGPNTKRDGLPPKKPQRPLEGLIIQGYCMWCHRCRKGFVWNNAPYKCPRRKCLETGKLHHLCVQCCKEVDDARKEKKKVKRLEKRKRARELRRLQ